MDLMGTRPRSGGDWRGLNNTSWTWRKRNRRLSWLAIALLGTVAHNTAGAQLGLDKLIDNFTDLGIYVGYGGFLPTSHTLSAAKEGASRQHGLLSYGTEFSFELGTIKRPICASGELRRCYAERDSTGRVKPLRTRTCSYVRTGISELRVEYKPSGPDSVLVFVGAEECDPPKEQNLWLFELAVGYSQLERFYSADVQSFTLNGSLKEFPTLALYATYQPPTVSPYVGVVLGITKLEDLQLTAPDTSFTASPSAVDAGLSAGLVTAEVPGMRSFLPFGVFLESSYHVRSFPSIRWSTPKLLPAGAPKRLNLSGWEVRLGFQASVKKKEKA